MKKHGNSNDNDAEHHLYEIHDVERNDVYNTGFAATRSIPMALHPVQTANSGILTVHSDGFVF